MKALLIINLITFVCLSGATISLADTTPRAKRDDRNTSTKSAQIGFSTIIVNGRALTGPNSSAQTRDGRLLIPIASLARALGDAVSVSPTYQTISVNRQNGVTALFDFTRRQVSENGSVVLSTSNWGAIIFTPNVEEIMLPVEIASALFDVSIRFDRQKNVVYVSRGIVGAVTNQKIKRSFAELYLAEYEYNLNRYSSANSLNLTLDATGRLGDGRFHFLVNSSSSSLYKFSPRNFSFNLDRPNGQRFIAGDFGTGSSLQLLTANIRGGLASASVGNFTVAAFGGRSYSGTFARDVNPDVSAVPRSQFSYDTSVFGVSVTTKPFDSGTFKPLTLSAGAIRFGGVSRSGTAASTSANFAGRRLQFQADFGIGTFKGKSLNDQSVNGTGIAVDVAASYQAARNLAFQGRYAHVGTNFLAPQSGVREPSVVKAAGASWSPVRWLTATVNASTTRQPNVTGRAESFIATAFAISPGGTKPQFYISHTQSSSRSYRKGEFTLVNFSKSFHRERLFFNATRVKNIGPASVNVQIGTAFLLNEKNTLEISQGIASHKTYNGQAEWRTDRLFGNRLNLTAGVGYSYAQTSGFRTYEKLTASLNLPRSTSLQISYFQNSGGPTLLVRVRGSLFRKHNAPAYLDASQGTVNQYGNITGRVYQDLNANGKYDAGIDNPQSAIKVRVDGNRYVETDANGLFSFEAVQSGEHKIYVDLLSVRADLTLLDGGSHDIILQPGNHTQLDFRLVRTGRISGRVWLDLNENGKFDDGETPLADIRIVTSSGRDTLTDADGYFVIGDLAPGEHVILIDEKTLPEKTKVGLAPRAMQVYPGSETGDVDLAVIMIPAEVKHFGLKTN